MLIAGERLFEIMRSSRAGQKSCSWNTLKAATARFCVRQSLVWLPVSVGVAAHGGHGQVQVAEAVGSGIEVASENRDLRNRQETGRVRVVTACPLDDLREMARGSGPADWLPEAGLRQGVALDRGDPPQSSPAVLLLISLRSRYPAASNVRNWFRAAFPVEAEYVTRDRDWACVVILAHHLPRQRRGNAADHVILRDPHPGSVW